MAEPPEPSEPSPASRLPQPRVDADDARRPDAPGEVDGPLLPSHRRRAEAFAVDLVVVAGVLCLAVVLDRLTSAPTLGLVAVAVAGWVYYVGTTAWLMDGQTAGKIICELRVRRLGPGSAPDTFRGLAWSVARHTIGYVVVDVFLIGTLLTFVDRRRRCLHDYAFASEVRQVAAPARPMAFWRRYRSYWEQFEERYDELRRRNRWIFFPWKWLTGFLIAADIVMSHVLPAEGAAAVAPAAPATPLPLKATAGLWAATVATGTILTVALWPPKPQPSEPFAVAPAGDHSDVDIAVAGDGDAFVAWFDVGADPDRVLVRHQGDGRWTDAVDLAEGFSSRGAAKLLTAPDGRVCAYFHGMADDSLDSYGLYERCWEDDGWSGPDRVADRGGGLTGITTGFAPAFAPDGALHVAWETPPDKVGYGDRVLSAPGTNGYLQSVTDTEGRLHVLWWNGETGDIDHRWSDDEGRTWSEPAAVDHNFTWMTAADGHGGIHVVSVAGGELAHYRWTVDTGWSGPVDVTGSDTNSLTYPGLIGLAEGGAAASWVRGDTLVVSELNDEGDPATAVTIPEAEERIAQSQLAAHDDTLHIAWLTDRGEIVHLCL